MQSFTVQNVWYDYICSGKKIYEGRPLYKIRDLALGQAITIKSPGREDLVCRIKAILTVSALSEFPNTGIPIQLVVPREGPDADYAYMSEVYNRYYPEADSQSFGFMLLSKFDKFTNDSK